ncbi:hypothetical protein CRG98_009108 [Punica granatum]|uniref:DUF7745 domain-containing protein n=2 Tax=Punica granatum TaxID=22663 RepID=A0A2I0KQL0_PUNGR|nr:hypothetical protein CRG98_009108 [Punica granatum]
MPTRDIVVPNQFATIQTRLAVPLDLRDEEIRRELQHEWDHSIKTEWLVDFIHVRALDATGESYQRDACHGFLLLIFGTILFPYSSNLVDGALAQVILQVVGGHSYVEAVLAETIQSLDYVREIRRARAIRQLSSLQDIPTEADRTPYCFMWADITALLPDKVLQIREVRRLWDTRIIQLLYFLEHPTDDERAFSATVAYVAQFHPQGVTPIRRLRTQRTPRVQQADIPDAETSVQGAMRTELQSISEEQDRLRCELVDIRAGLTD